MLNCRQALRCQQAFLKPCLVNLISKFSMSLLALFLIFGVLVYICHLGNSHGTNLSWTVALVIIRNRITSLFIFLLGKFQRTQKRWSVDTCLLVTLLPSHQWTEVHKDLGHPQLLKYLFCQTFLPICCLHAVKSRLDLINLELQSKRPQVKLSPK